MLPDQLFEANDIMIANSDLKSELYGARTLLFVPGNRPERFIKALDSGADAVILDLEDSVPPMQKGHARAVIAENWRQIASSGVPVIVRINAIGSEFGRADLEWLSQLKPQVGVMVSKAESAQQLHQVADLLPDYPIFPLIETALGFIAAAALAGCAGVLRLVVGHIDFMADTGIRCSDDERELDALRFQVAVLTRAYGLAPAIDGVTVSIDDDVRLESDSRRALKFGFGGKLCIHPLQIGPVIRALTPTAEEVSWAQRVLDADHNAGGAAVQIDGRMVDLPVVLQAKATLARVRLTNRS